MTAEDFQATVLERFETVDRQFLDVRRLFEGTVRFQETSAKFQEDVLELFKSNGRFQEAVLKRFDQFDQRLDALRDEFRTDMAEMASDINALFNDAQRREDEAHAAIGRRLEAIEERLRAA